MTQTQPPMRMYQLFARIKGATPELEGGKGYMLRLRQELYDLLRFIIQRRREIPLENDNLETMHDKSLDITRYLHDNKESLTGNYEHNFLFLLALAMEALGKDVDKQDGDEEKDEGYSSSTEDFEGDASEEYARNDEIPVSKLEKSPRFCGWLKKAMVWTLQTSALVALNAIVLKQVMDHVSQETRGV